MDSKSHQLANLSLEDKIREEQRAYWKPQFRGPLPVTEADRQQLLGEWNATTADYPQDQCLQQLFEAQVERTPEALAVACADEQLSYRELNHRANQLAHHLQALGVGPEVLVGLCVERSVEMVIGLLGILKAGGAYVPLDPAYPQERLAFMLADTQLPILLTQERLLQALPEHGAQVVCLDTQWEGVARESAGNPASGTTPDNLAYVIYTSGSTGTPKGVLGLHRGAINRFAWMWATYPFTADEVGCQKTSLNFVDSVWELFGPLLAGIRTVIIPDELLKDPQRLVQTLAAQRVTRLVLVPSLLRTLLDSGVELQSRLPSLKVWISSGESLPLEVARRFLAALPHSTLLNLYGSSEVAADVTAYEVGHMSAERLSVPIGRPIANMQVYLLDSQLQPVPIGVSGELYIGGAGLARGYLNRPELTAEKFIPHPFSDEPGARLYRTGDLARYLPDGNLEFLGRLDHQVKLRGFRIELGEIEAVVGRHPAVGQSVVLAREDTPGEKRLVAYVVPAQLPAPSHQELRRFLQAQLPEYMMPSAFVWLDTLPLTPNGKVDRRALPAPDLTRPELEKTFVAPRDALERQLARLWAKVLGTTPIGVHDNFFELGGHSLLAVRLCEQIEQKFGRTLSPAILFQAPTIEQLACLLRQENYVAHSWSLVVPFQTNGSKPPFFCLFCSAELALLLGPEQPFYALQPHGLAGRRAPATVEAAAADYVREIQAVQPQGPYFLGGFSFGGLVVFEMAQQLSRQGQQVAFLALLDPPLSPQRQFSPLAGPTSLPLLTNSPRVRERIIGHARALARLGLREQVTYVLQRVRGRLTGTNRGIKQLVCRLYLGLGRRLPFALRALYFLETSGQATRRYRPHVYPGRAVLFHTPHSAPTLQADWGRLVTGGLEVQEVPGEHLDIIREPYVRTLAAKLGACLSQAQTVRAGKKA